MVRSNAESLKPQTLSYSDATVTTVKEHLKRVRDWINNIYPGGYTFPHYLFNFTSTINLAFSAKADRLKTCKTEDDLKEMIDEIMEVKFPIHSRRIEALNPSIRSNEEASSFLKRTLVDFTDTGRSTYLKLRFSKNREIGYQIT